MSSSQIVVRFFITPEFGCTDEQFYENRHKECIDFIKNKDIILTYDDNYTHAIIFNKAMPELKIKKENVIGFANEPTCFLNMTDEFIKYAEKHIGTYFIGEKLDNYPDLFKEHYGYLCHNFVLNAVPSYKPKIMSIIISHKQWTPNQTYRHHLVKRILNSNLPIDIYGNGCYLYENRNDSRLKGPFEKKSILPFLDYKYHICIENYALNHYFSEKIINPFLCNTTPIYGGCNNINEYFSQASVSHKNPILFLTGNIEDDFKMIQTICENPEPRDEISIDYVLQKISLYNKLKEMWL